MKINNTPQYNFSAPSFSAKYRKTKDIVKLINNVAGTTDAARLSEALDKTDSFFKKAILNFSKQHSPKGDMFVVTLEEGNTSVRTNINNKFENDNALFLIENISNPSSGLHKKLFGKYIEETDIANDKNNLVSKLV